jgi:CubicO group peptidase (beta-lactamase class C family)
MDIVKPEEVGLSSTRLNRINTVMQQYVDRNEIPGAVTMVVRRGKVAYLQATGMMDVESGKAMQPDTIFRIYSMTKPVASVAIMMLFEEGHFQLNYPVSQFIPEFKELKVFAGEDENGAQLTDLEREVTIRDLLTHTSGLVYGNPLGSTVEKMAWEMTPGENPVVAPSGETVFGIPLDETLGEWITKLVKVPLAHQPGKAWSYGTSTDVLGYLVEVVSGTSLDDFAHQRILEPLGMVDTTFHLPDEKLDRFSTMYCPEEGGGLRVVDPPVSSAWSVRKKFISGGGGPGRALVSTAPDYARFCQMLLNNGSFDGRRYLSRNAVNLMTRNNLPEGVHLLHEPGVGFGHNFWVMLDPGMAGTLSSEGSYGWYGYAGTSFIIDPQEEMIGIALIQNVGWSWAAQDAFPTLMYQSIID